MTNQQREALETLANEIDGHADALTIPYADIESVAESLTGIALSIRKLAREHALTPMDVNNGD